MIFTGYTGSKNPVLKKLKIQFVELDFSKLIFQKSSSHRSTRCEGFFWKNVILMLNHSEIKPPLQNKQTKKIPWFSTTWLSPSAQRILVFRIYLNQYYVFREWEYKTYTKPLFFPNERKKNHNKVLSRNYNCKIYTMGPKILWRLMHFDYFLKFDCLHDKKI